ncbi:hypothetical protein AVEN_64470-1 [Araneus ventricosus]|uniref:Uncharacterized protein n=1 Tax=Araneus ventricosus TaxID=182803 RepID=A0A4Y2TEX8_ARAVE|nr:hypothetical protein AVEN_64470-1 [Araneus ventricosus]
MTYLPPWERKDSLLREELECLDRSGEISIVYVSWEWYDWSDSERQDILKYDLKQPSHTSWGKDFAQPHPSIFFQWRRALGVQMTWAPVFGVAMESKN